jgi:hypothetical protein
MAGNATPIYSRVGAISLGTGITAIVTDYDGTGVNNVVAFTADATNGGYVQRIRFKAKGTNAVSVARIYFNNGSSNTTATNNTFYGEISLPATTGITTAATAEVDYPINVALPPGYRIIIGISAGTTLASGWVPTVIAGAY